MELGKLPKAPRHFARARTLLYSEGERRGANELEQPVAGTSYKPTHTHRLGQWGTDPRTIAPVLLIELAPLS